VRAETKEGLEAVTAGEGSAGRNGRRRGLRVGSRSADPGNRAIGGAYRIQERNEADVKLYTYFYPESDPLADNYLKAAAGFLELYGTSSALSVR
jgi:hypothetical protein